MVVVCVSGQWSDRVGYGECWWCGLGPEEEEEGEGRQDLSVAVVSCGAQHPAIRPPGILGSGSGSEYLPCITSGHQ